MDAGRLDRRVSLLRASTLSTNDFNEAVTTWRVLASVAANVVPVSDGERIRAGETLSSMMSRFTIRYSSTVADLDPRDRISYDGRQYDIRGVKEVGRREFLEITAAARAEAP